MNRRGSHLMMRPDYGDSEEDDIESRYDDIVDRIATLVTVLDEIPGFSKIQSTSRRM